MATRASNIKISRRGGQTSAQSNQGAHSTKSTSPHSPLERRRSLRESRMGPGIRIYLCCSMSVLFTDSGKGRELLFLVRSPY